MSLNRGAGLWLPPFALMALIFFFSAQPDLSSGLGTLDLVLRKVVHFAEYGLLCFLLWRPLRTVLSPGRAILLALAHRLRLRSHRRVAPDVRGGSPRDPRGLADRLRRRGVGRRAPVDARAPPASDRLMHRACRSALFHRCWSSPARAWRCRSPVWRRCAITRYDGWENTALVIGGLVVPWSIAVLLLALRDQEAALGPIVMCGDLVVLLAVELVTPDASRGVRSAATFLVAAHAHFQGERRGVAARGGLGHRADRRLGDPRRLVPRLARGGIPRHAVRARHDLDRPRGGPPAHRRDRVAPPGPRPLAPHDARGGRGAPSRGSVDPRRPRAGPDRPGHDPLHAGARARRETGGRAPASCSPTPAI